MSKKESNDLRDYNHVDLLFPSDYLKAADLGGRDVTVRIKSIEPRHELKTNRGTEFKPVVTFHGTDKKWVLNKTNAKTIAKIYGPEATGWIGKSVTLFSAEVSAFGEMVDAVRVRSDEPKKNSNGTVENDSAQLDMPADPYDMPPFEDQGAGF